MPLPFPDKPVIKNIDHMGCTVPLAQQPGAGFERRCRLRRSPRQGVRQFCIKTLWQTAAPPCLDIEGEKTPQKRFTQMRRHRCIEHVGPGGNQGCPIHGSDLFEAGRHQLATGARIIL